MPLLPNLNDWQKPGVLWPRGDHLQEPVTALRTLANNVGTIEGMQEYALGPNGGLLAVITGNGPSDDGKSGADDLKGCQYWIKLQLIQSDDGAGEDDQQSDTDDPITLFDDTQQNSQTQANGSIGSGQPTILIATNLCEYVYGDSPDAIGSHYLNTDDTQTVEVFGWWDSGPPTNSHIHYVFFCPPGSFWAKITGATGLDPMTGASPYMYDWVKQKELLDPTTGLVSLVNTDPAVTGTYASTPKTGAYNAWELPGNTGYTALDNDTIVEIKVTYAYPVDKTKAAIPVLRFTFPTIDECSNPPDS